MCASRLGIYVATVIAAACCCSYKAAGSGIALIDRIWSLFAHRHIYHVHSRYTADMSFTSNDDAASSALYSFSSFLTSLLPSARADEAAPAPSDDSEEDKSADSSSKEDKEDSDDKATEAGGEDAEEGEGAGEEAEEEEEEEEEPEDEYPAIREQCAESKECINLKHHFEHCSEKVNAGKGHKGEDCVEELFHLMHCVDTCSAPKIFARLR